MDVERGADGERRQRQRRRTHGRAGHRKDDVHPDGSQQVLLPDMFEPLTISSRVSGVRKTSFLHHPRRGHEGMAEARAFESCRPSILDEHRERVVTMLVRIRAERAERFDIQRPHPAMR